MTNIDSILTHATLKEIRHIDYNKLIADKREQIDSLFTLVKNDAKDKNVQLVLKMYHDQLEDLRKESNKWIELVGYKIHHDHKIVILIEEIKDEE